MTRLCLFLCLWLSLWSGAALASVLAIDYGADSIKASLMKPGQPFDVLLNRDSKRKIQATVGWKHNDRLFGQDAANIVSIVCIQLRGSISLTSIPTLSHLHPLRHSGRSIPAGFVLASQVPPGCAIRL